MEMPVRTPGAPTWPAVAKHGREVRRQQERQRRLQEKARAAPLLAISSSLALSPVLSAHSPTLSELPCFSHSQERRLKERALRREEASATPEQRSTRT